MKNLLPVLTLAACATALHASTFTTTASATGCHDTGTLDSSCLGSDGSMASATITPSTLGVQTILDAQGSPSFNGPFGGQASATINWDTTMVLEGRAGTGWVEPVLERHVTSSTTGDQFSGGVYFPIFDPPSPVQIAFGDPFSFSFAFTASAFADSRMGQPIQSHLDATIAIGSFKVYLKPPGTPGLERLMGTAGLSGNFDPSQLQVFDTIVEDVATPEPAAFFLVVPALVGFARYRSR